MGTHSGNVTYRFVKVDDFFQDYRSWSFISGLKSWSLAPDKKTLELVLTRSDNQGEAGALIEFVQAGTVRFRFNPAKRVEDYTGKNSRSRSSWTP
jgi:alpha-glucosidase